MSEEQYKGFNPFNPPLTDEQCQAMIESGTYILKWGENISKENMGLLNEGHRFLLIDENGAPYSEIVKDSYGAIRERPIGWGRPA